MISSESNPRIKAVVRLRKQSGSRGRRKTGLLIAEGLREVSRAIGAGLVVEEVFATEAFDEQAFGDDALEGHVITLVSEAVMNKMAYHREGTQVLAVLHVPKEVQFEEGQLPGPGAGGRSGVWLVAVGTAKPGNLGAMARSAEAFGCDGVISAGTYVDAFHPNAIRTSTGAVFSLPMIQRSEDEAMVLLRQMGATVFVAMLDESGQSTMQAMLETVQRQRKSGQLIAIVIGPEDVGLSRAWGEFAKDTGGGAVMISMQGQVVDSLNASVAAGILLWAVTQD